MRAPFIWARQGEVSMTIGILPPSEAFTKDCSSCWPMWEAAPLKPLLLNIIPQQLLLSPCTCRAAVRTAFMQLNPAAYDIKAANIWLWKRTIHLNAEVLHPARLGSSFAWWDAKAMVSILQQFCETLLNSTHTRHGMVRKPKCQNETELTSG